MRDAADERFSSHRKSAAKRRRGRAVRRVAILLVFGTVGTGALVVGWWMYQPIHLSAQGDDAESTETADEDMETLDDVQVVPIFDAPAYKPTIVDLPGDPLVIDLGSAERMDGGSRVLPANPDAAGAGILGEIRYLREPLTAASADLMLSLPTSPQQFAFFQSQRRGATYPTPQPHDAEDFTDAPVDVEAPAEPDAGPFEGYPVAEVSDEDAAGWGETIDQGQEALPTFQKTRIEDTTSMISIVPEASRRKLAETRILRALVDRPLRDLLTESGLTAAQVDEASVAAERVFGTATVKRNEIVSLRLAPADGDDTRIVQLAGYSREKYLGAIARGENGDFVAGADPWLKDDLLSHAMDPPAGETRRYRYLDAIYSAALRNKVPPAIVAQTIVYLSRTQDLAALAGDDDVLTLLYVEGGAAKDAGPGKTPTARSGVLYASVSRTGADPMECYVMVRKDGSTACGDAVGGAPSSPSPSAMTTPVSEGVLTSRFGPRKHPVLGVVRIHAGVDWAARIGTPVVAAYDGTVSLAEVHGGYGNLVRLDHGAGRETQYAHLSRYAAGLRKGSKVKAGELVGYVGTTGLSTGPHLHFELHVTGKAVDPLAPLEPQLVAESVFVEGTVGGGGEEEAFLARIVHAESRGNTKAKNPLSTATGLGQFIEDTWLRMISTYRPDLSRSLSRAAILDLRTDPTVGMEMLRNLTRENAAYLKGKGYDLSAGRLYLAHFLGAGGATEILSAPSDRAVADIVTPGAMRANPFLAGMTSIDIQNWATRKMTGRKKGAPTTTTVVSAKPAAQPVPTGPSPEYLAYKKIVAGILETATSI